MDSEMISVGSSRIARLCDNGMKDESANEVEVEIVETDKRQLVAKYDLQKMNEPKFDKV